MGTDLQIIFIDKSVIVIVSAINDFLIDFSIAIIIDAIAWLGRCLAALLIKHDTSGKWVDMSQCKTHLE